MSGIFIDSRALFRLSIPFIVLLLSNFAIASLVSMHLSDARAQIDDAASSAVLLHLTSEVRSILIWGMSVLGAFSFFLWIIFSHRIFGPVVPIRRQIQNLIKGHCDGQIVLRKHDELREIAADLNQLTDVIKNERGQLLVQVMVASAISMIVMAAVANFQANQATENRALAEKLSAIDLGHFISATESSTTVCSLLFGPGNLVGGTGTLTFDSTKGTTIDLRAVPGPVGSPAVVTLGGQASTESRTLTVLPAGGIQIAMTSATSGNLLINFDQTKLVRSIHNLSIPLVIQSSGPPGATVISACGTGGLPGTLYKCPNYEAPCGSGAWYSQGCNGQITTMNYCVNLTRAFSCDCNLYMEVKCQPLGGPYPSSPQILQGCSRTPPPYTP